MSLISRKFPLKWIKHVIKTTNQRRIFANHIKTQEQEEKDLEDMYKKDFIEEMNLLDYVSYIHATRN